MTQRFEARWQQALRAREQAHLTRQRRSLSGPQGLRVRLDGRSFVSFASNDYLGLAAHPELGEAFSNAIAENGVGSGASHMVCGHHEEHEQLELELAEFTGRERALVFGSGYAANLSALATLATRNDLILQDKLNHASLLDGAALSGARSLRYQHADTDSLRLQLERIRDSQKAAEQILVATDGVFSMDGDMAPLADIAKLCADFDALLVVDDAHGMGVLGEQGAGSVSAQGLSPSDVPVLIGTFGKAFGTAGAFVAGSTSLISFFEQFARPYIYTTAMPPALASATRQSLKLIKYGDALRRKLQNNIALFRTECRAAGFALMDSSTAIQPLIVGGNDATMRLGGFLEEAGVLVGQIRPPTVREGSARLRITLSAGHDESDISRLLDTLRAAQKQGMLS